MRQMPSIRVRNRFLSMIAAALLAGCGGSSQDGPALATQPLDPAQVNLVFVVSEDLDNHAPGDVNPVTAGLTSQGLQRTLAMGSFLRQSVMGGSNVMGIHALEPMTHLQTANGYADMNALMAVQPLAMLNQTTLSSDLTGGSPYTGQNAPIFASYASGAVPAGVAVPSAFHPVCQGIDYLDTLGNNETLINAIIANKTAGNYVISAPWTTIRSTLGKLSSINQYNLAIPTAYAGPNRIYAISIPAAGSVRFSAYDSGINPPSAYPTLDPSAIQGSTPPAPSPATLTVTGGVGGAVIPSGINRNEVLYLVRHAEAHPHGYWSDNNYVGAGQWRALDLPYALAGRISPDQVWSLDPAQSTVGTVSSTGVSQWSSVAPALTVQPFAIKNALPFNLVAAIDTTASNAVPLLSDFFFFGSRFTNHKLLGGWVFTQNPQIVNALVSSYFPNGGAPAAPAWAATDYDSLWVVALDADGNLTVDFSQCEGINSATLPALPPTF
jgi:hypothetical protein